MTRPGRPDRPSVSGAAPSSGTESAHPSGQGGPDPERVLEQALRAMAGGGKPLNRSGSTRAGAGFDRSPLSGLQILLIATIVGLLVGVTVGLITLLV